MDEAERLAIEREVQIHMTRVEALLAQLNELEENLKLVVDAPPELTAQVRAIRLELRGRMAAISMGESRLGVDPF